MKTRGDSIIEYANAFKRENGNVEAATILYNKLEWLFSADHISREIKIRCISEEIENILFVSNTRRYLE